MKKESVLKVVIENYLKKGHASEPVAIIPDYIEIWENNSSVIEYDSLTEPTECSFIIYPYRDIFIQDYLTNLKAFQKTINQAFDIYHGFGDDTYYDELPSMLCSLINGYHQIINNPITIEPEILEEIHTRLTQSINRFIKDDSYKEGDDPETMNDFKEAAIYLKDPKHYKSYLLFN